jgi:hypothetical protein
MATTAGGLIEEALRRIGQLAESELPSAATMQDSIVAFNNLLESWSIERLSVFSTQTQVYTWPANQRVRTLGPTGDFVGTRPVEIDASTYFIDPTVGISFGVNLVSQIQYNSLALKTVTSTYPSVLWVNMTYPNIELTVYPVPTLNLEWHLVSVQNLAPVTSSTSEINFPLGYKRAFSFNLSCELAAQFGVEPLPRVVRIADISKRNLKRINAPLEFMAIPYPIPLNKSRYNIYTDNN